MKPKIITIRLIRKSSHILNRLFSKGEKFSYRVEDKTTRILTGRDFSSGVFKQEPFEKIFYNGIPFNIVPLNPALPAVGRKGKLTLLIPSLNKGSFYGGTATALIVAGKLSKLLKKDLRILETLRPGGKEGIQEFFKSNGLDIKEEDIELIDVSARRYNVYGYVDLHEDDIFIASAWWDAQLLNQLPLSKKFIYLIQDYEPIFYANSDKYLLAENTYKSGKFVALHNTKLMYDFMSDRYPQLKKSFWFEPAVSQLPGGLSIENKTKKKIFLYGRPMVERNLFYSGIYVLNEVFSKNILSPNDWEIFMAGQDNLPSITLSTGIIVRNLGKMHIDDYRKFARTIDITLSLMMAPHPNYPTLELASVGSAVVTTRYENKKDLSGYSKNIIMADTSIPSIVEAVAKASELVFDQRIANAKASNIESDWDKTLNNTLKQVLASLE